MNLYIVVEDNNQKLGIFNTYFFLENSNEMALEGIKQKLLGLYDREIKSSAITTIQENNSYFAIIEIVYLTDDEDIVKNTEFTDTYRVYNFGEPVKGILYPNWGCD